MTHAGTSNRQRALLVVVIVAAVAALTGLAVAVTISFTPTTAPSAAAPPPVEPIQADEEYPAEMPLQDELESLTLDVDACTPTVDCAQPFQRAGAAASTLQDWFNHHGDDLGVGEAVVKFAQANLDYSQCEVGALSGTGPSGCFDEAQAVEDSWSAVLDMAKSSNAS